MGLASAINYSALMAQNTKPFRDGRWVAETRPAWQLLPGHYDVFVPFPDAPYASQTAADTFDNVIYPRPDSETETWSRQRWAHPAMDYELEIGVRGGAFPYHMEIDTAATHASLIATATIGVFGAANEYVFKIPAATMATLAIGTNYPVVIKVTSQNHTKKVKVFWSFQMEPTPGANFLFVNNAKGTNGTGTFSDEFNTMVGLTSTQTLKRILVVKEGVSRTTTPYTKDWTGNYSATGWPCAQINIPGERPKVDLLHGVGSGAMFGLSASTSDDFIIRGFEIINGLNSAKTISDGIGAFNSGFNALWHRTAIQDCIFDTVQSWGPSGVNPAGIKFEKAGATHRNHLMMSNLVFRNFAPTTGVNSGAPIAIMGWKKSLIDKITFENIGVGGGVNSMIFLKRNFSELCLRRLTGTLNNETNGTNPAIYFGAQSENGNGECRDMEFSFMNFNIPSRRILRGPIDYEAARVDGIFSYYRNTSRSNGAAMSKSNATLVNFKDNVTVGNSDLTQGSNVKSVGSRSGLLLTDFNPDGTLTSTYLTANGLERGVVGHEIA